MAKAQDLRRIVATLAGAVESEHMGHPDFRVRGKIFATLWPGEEIAVFRLARDEQQALILSAPETFSPAAKNSGWTKGHLARIPVPQLEEVLRSAWKALAGKRR